MLLFSFEVYGLRVVFGVSDLRGHVVFTVVAQRIALFAELNVLNVGEAYCDRLRVLVPAELASFNAHLVITWQDIFYGP